MKRINYFYLLMTAIISMVVLRAQSDKPRQYQLIDNYRWLPLPGKTMNTYGDTTIVSSDTLPLIFLCSDTSRLFLLRSSSESYSHTKDCDTSAFHQLFASHPYKMDTAWFSYNPTVFWIKGFRVRTNFTIKIANKLVEEHFRYDFLNENKQPLKKSIIIWQERIRF